MTITNTIYISEVETLRTKTEVAISEEETRFTRLIKGKIRTIAICDPEMTISAASRVCKLDNEMFVVLSLAEV